MIDIVLKIENDGIDHLNVYTRASTSLGRMMSNLYDSNIEHPVHGHFRTLEGLWYYLKTGKKNDMLRIVSGFDARKIGSAQETVWDQNFQHEFKVGIICKILANQDLQKQLVESTLPFVHYYFYGKEPGKQKLIVPKGHEWQMEFWDTMRQHLKSNRDIFPIIDKLLKYEPSQKEPSSTAN